MTYSARFPAVRSRRLRGAEWIRRLTRETGVSTADLIWPVFLHDKTEDEAIPSLPGVSRLCIRSACVAATRARTLGIPVVAIFPHIEPDQKDASGVEALNPNGLVNRAVRAMKDAAPEVGLMVDIALDPFTDHGHDGLVADGRVLNDETVAVLAEQALAHVRAGADIVAPSDMMDGRVGAIRTALEAGGHHDTLIMSYAAKYASGFYGPYRQAIGSAKLGDNSNQAPTDKNTYQMDFGNAQEALREVALDVTEGADLLLVKPGMPYLDIVQRVKSTFGLPTFAYQVSGEYAMIKAAAANGWIDEDRAILESLAAFKRAGADGVITYFAPRIVELLG